jgi:hypothetical protein
MRANHLSGARRIDQTGEKRQSMIASGHFGAGLAPERRAAFAEGEGEKTPMTLERLYKPLSGAGSSGRL